MKKLLFLLFLIPVFAAAQKTTGGNYTYIAQRYEWLTGLFQALNIPAGDSAQHKSGQDMRAGALYYDTLGIDAGLKIWNGLAWGNIGTGGFFSPDQTSTGNTSHNAAGFDFSINNINDLTLNTDNAIINSANDILIDALGRAYIEADDSIQFLSATGTYNFQNTIASSDTTEMKPAALSSTGQLRRMSYWPGGGGSGNAYTSVYQIDAVTFALVRDDATEDTITIDGLAATYVDTIWRVPGEDSIRYTKGGTEYAIKDSVGTGGGGASSFGIIQAATYNLTNSAALQKLFDVGGTGAITLTANTTYQFECMFSLSSMSATSGNCGFDIIGAGTATATAAHWAVVGRDGTSLNTATNSTGIFSSATAETGNIVAAATSVNMYAYITGMIRINGGGTIIPSINLTNAAAAVVGVNSFFKLTEIGSGSVTSW